MRAVDSIPELMTLKETCEMLKCHPNTLRQWDRNGILKAVRFGKRHDRRYRREDIVRLLKTKLEGSISSTDASGLDFFEREAETAIDRIRRLQFITAELSRVLSSQEVADIILSHGMKALGGSAGAIAILDADKRNLRVVASVGFPKRLTAKWKSIPLSTHIPLCECIRLSEPILIETVDEYTKRYPGPLVIPPLPHHQSFASIPLIIDGNVIGGLSFRYSAPQMFRKNDVSFMLALARQCALAIERTRLYDSEKEARSRAESIQKKFAAIIESIAEGYVAVDAKWNIIHMNKNVARILGVNSQSANTMHIWRCKGMKGHRNLYNAAAKVKHDNAGMSVEEFFPHLKAWYEVRIYPSPSDTHILFRDITESKRSEDRVRDSERRFRALIERSSDVIALMDQHGIMTYVSASSTGVLGYTPDELVGKLASHLIHPDDRGIYAASRQQVLSAPYASRSGIFRALHKDGTYRWIEGVATNLLTEPGVHAVVTNVRDITDRKIIEGKLNTSQERFRDALDLMKEYAICLIDQHGTIIDWNPTAQHLFGYTKTDVVGRYYGMLFTPEDRDSGIPAMELSKVKKTGKANDDRWLVKKDGTAFFVQGVVLLLKDAPEGNIFAKIIRDVSEHKRMEEVRDEFVSVAGHELKAPVSSIQAYAQLLQKHMRKQQDMDALHLLMRMGDQITRLNSLIRDLLDVTRIESGVIDMSMQRVSLNKPVRDTVEDVQHMLTHHTITVSGKASHVVVADPQRISQVLTNLLLNAAKYSPDSDTIQVSLRATKSDLIVSVRDFGVGIAAEARSRVFEKFYRIAKGRGVGDEGLGLGLYISSKIISLHNGRVWVESPDGIGSIFSFSLPLVKTKSAR